MKTLVCAALAASAFAAPAVAQDRAIAFELGLGLRTAPAYEGSDDYVTGPTGSASLSALQMFGLNIDRGDGLGFGFGPSFRYIAERDHDDHRRLTGIDDVDAALEIGAKLSYNWGHAEVSGALRKGFGGHHGLVADLAADAIIPVGSSTEVRVGPRLSFADDAYMETYFDVPGGAFLPSYSADGGLYKTGLEVSVSHDFNDVWAVEGALGWNHLTGDAGDSPIVENQGSGTVSVLLVRKFDFRF